jgi:hypothetical protein
MFSHFRFHLHFLIHTHKIKHILKKKNLIEEDKMQIDGDICLTSKISHRSDKKRGVWGGG